jgi:AmmeMemoRadiSam system protein B/AmmeMemoRadiSam system protein A
LSKGKQGRFITMPANSLWVKCLWVILPLVYGVSLAGGLQAHDRPPVWAGQFYPAEKQALADTIERLTQQARQNQPLLPAHKPLKALILPHAGYAYSGPVAAQAWHVLSGSHFTKVILLGPDHRVGFSGGAVSDAAAWITPLGRVRLDPDCRRLLAQSDLFRTVPASDGSEHCLEVELPFLQTYLQDFQMVPVVLGPCDPGRVAQAIEPLCDAQTLLVVSADLSHYLPYAQAIERDQDTIRAILELNAQPILSDANRSCGKYPIAVLLGLARKHGWQSVLLHYANSGDTAGDRSRVVGYAAVAFFGEEPMPTLSHATSSFSQDQGQALVDLARQTLLTHFKRPIKPDQAKHLEGRLQDPALQSHCGTFVTLTINGQLRGCIGSLVGYEPVVEGVRSNAVNAAFRDPRFRPLTDEELDRVRIEVSILSEPQPLDYNGADDLTAKLRPHIDGVTIRKGLAGATFLPQVWEQLPDVQVFLSHLCNKAGLAGDAWRRGDLEVQTYQVQHFEESD